MYTSQLFSLQIFEKYLTGFLPLSILVSALVSYRFSRPIAKIRKNVYFLSLKKFNSDPNFQLNEDVLQEDWAEFSDIDASLFRIQKKIKKRKDQLMNEREESEAFMSSVQEGLISFDLMGQVRYFNSQFATQFLSSEQIQGPIYFTDIFRVPELVHLFDEVISSGTSQKISLKMTVNFNLSSKYFLISLTPLRKPKTKEFYGVYGVFHDISDIQKAEQIRIDFVGNASHELKTPLTSMKGYVDTLKEDLKNKEYDQANKFAEIVSRNVNRLIELVNDLLTISKLESEPQLNFESIHALSLTQNVVDEFQIQASEKSLMIQIRGNVPDFQADLFKIEQVLRNLISNCIKYVQPHGQIQVVWENDEFKNVVLRVIDDGPGIPEESQERLFERFYRVDKGRYRESGGTGLGLAIVKHIVQSHGGQVYVRSQLLKGSEFICVFPPKK